MKNFIIKPLIFLLLLAAVVIYPNIKKGTANSFFQPAGGQITNVTYCTCEGAVLDYVQDVVTNSQKQLLYMPGATQLYANYNPFISGPQTVANYTPVSTECLVESGEDCNSEGNPDGIWYLLGTSAL